ncbi:MAG TPA: hypothetical protein VKG63_06520 [Steroidobacteraceae bacterium]|nr:hypothetical protein [Steroidobacteraceae bacterium]
MTTATAPPVELLNVTVAPATPALLASSAVAVMFDDVLPSTAMVAGLAATDTFATLVGVPPPGFPGVPVSVPEPPPQPAKSAVAIQAMIENLRMSFILARR